jgi:hypothetical protein
MQETSITIERERPTFRVPLLQFNGGDFDAKAQKTLSDWIRPQRSKPESPPDHTASA